jgi:hypothetical protein
MVNADELAAIAAFVSEKGASEQTVSALRSQYSGCHFTYCMDDDISTGKPYYEGQDFNLYLVNSSNHCAILTNDETSASGVVIAEVIE